MPQIRQFIQMMCNGEFLNKDPNEAWQYFDQLVENAQSWDTSVIYENSSYTNYSTTAGGSRYHLKEGYDMNARIASLARKVEAMESMELKMFNEIKFVQKEEVCSICEIMGHATHEYPTIPAFKEDFIWSSKCYEYLQEAFPISIF